MDGKPEFIILADTHLTCKIEDREIMLENYYHYARI